MPEFRQLGLYENAKALYQPIGSNEHIYEYIDPRGIAPSNSFAGYFRDLNQHANDKEISTAYYGRKNIAIIITLAILAVVTLSSIAYTFANSGGSSIVYREIYKDQTEKSLELSGYTPVNPYVSKIDKPHPEASIMKKEPYTKTNTEQEVIFRTLKNTINLYPIETLVHYFCSENTGTEKWLSELNLPPLEFQLQMNYTFPMHSIVNATHNLCKWYENLQNEYEEDKKYILESKSKVFLEFTTKLNKKLAQLSDEMLFPDLQEKDLNFVKTAFDVMKSQYFNPTLRFTGSILSLASIQSYIKAADLNGIENIEVFATREIIMNSNFSLPRNRTQQNGINLFLVAPEWIFTSSSIIIDLRGINGENYTTPAKGGIDGSPGNPGGNGGIFFGVGSWSNDSKIIIRSEGGDGGSGQHGSDGKDGILRENVTESDYSCKHFHRSYMNAKNITNDVYHLFDFKSCGGNGTKGGAGGAPGNGGFVYIKNLRNNQLIGVQSLNGKRGANGKPGKSGVGAKNVKYYIGVSTVEMPLQIIGRGFLNDSNAPSGSIDRDINYENQHFPPEQKRMTSNSAISHQLRVFYMQQDFKSKIQNLYIFLEQISDDLQSLGPDIYMKKELDILRNSLLIDNLDCIENYYEEILLRLVKRSTKENVSTLIDEVLIALITINENKSKYYFGDNKDMLKLIIEMDYIVYVKTSHKILHDHYRLTSKQLENNYKIPPEVKNIIQKCTFFEQDISQLNRKDVQMLIDQIKVLVVISNLNQKVQQHMKSISALLQELKLLSTKAILYQNSTNSSLKQASFFMTASRSRILVNFPGDFHLNQIQEFNEVAMKSVEEQKSSFDKLIQRLNIDDLFEYNENISSTQFSTNSVNPPFYTWTNITDKIRALFSGEEIQLEASVVNQHVLNKEAIKFIDIGLEFVGDPELSKKLEHFKIILKHPGISTFYFEGETVQIFTKPFTIDNMLANSRTNTINIIRMMQLKRLGLSPYTTWSLQLEPISYIAKWDDLITSANNTELHLSGEGVYIHK